MEPTVSMEEFARDPIKWLEQARAKEENFLISDHGELIAQVTPFPVPDPTAIDRLREMTMSYGDVLSPAWEAEPETSK
ncbi:hypothetical protein [Pseudoduganella sp. R-34]|uniref:hypothetical protein n=1 Tax=Pseudoduganella sp. R-34 TaxID=3404062 RepID=UPI003CEC20ED